MNGPVLARTLPDGSRTYEHPLTGERVPSVTTVMKAGINKPALVAWAARTAAKHAVDHWEALDMLPPLERVQAISAAHEDIREAASVKGNYVHDVIDKWNKGEPVETDKSVRAQVDQFTDFMMTRKPKFAETEVTLWSRKHGYAGTADWIAEIDGWICLGDNKTGKRVYPEVGLQLSALAHADFILREDGTEDPIPPIDKLYVLHIRPRSWKIHYISEDDANFRCFLAAREIYRWLHETQPYVLPGVPYRRGGV